MADQASLGDISSSKDSDSTDLKNNSQLNLGPFKLKLPENWSITQFKQDIELVNGVNYESKHYCEEGEGRIFLTLNAVKKGGGFKQDGIKHYGGPVDDEKILSPGDLLIANTDLTQDGEVVGYPFQVPEFSGDEREIVPSMDLSIMDLKNEKFNKTFLQYLFRTNYIHSRLRSFSAGSTVLHLNTDLTENMDLPVPPKDEQRRIASVLYNVDQAISKTEEIIEQTQRVKKGLMQDLFTEGYYSHEEFREERFGPKKYKIPDSWETKRLGEISKVTVGHVGSVNEHNTGENGVPLLSTKNISEQGLLLEDYDYVSREFHENHQKSQLHPGDIMIARHGDSGKASAVTDEVEEAHCLNTIIVKDIDEISSKFLESVLNTEATRKRLMSWKSGSVQKVVNTTVLQKFEVPVPSQEEQEKMIDLINSIDNQIRNYTEEKEQLQRLKKGLMQDLLTGSVRTGEDVRVLDEVVEVEG